MYSSVARPCSLCLVRLALLMLSPSMVAAWVCPQGFTGPDQCHGSQYNSNCCGYSIPGENCGDRTADCYCYQWNCPGPAPSWEVLPEPEQDNSTGASDNLRRLRRW